MVLKKINKKSMVFTMLTIAMISLFIVSLSVYSVVQDRAPVKKRIRTMNDFVYAAEKDLERELFVSGFRAIFLLQERALQNRTYLESGTLQGNFSCLLINGSFNPGGNVENLMINATFENMIEKLNSTAREMNAEISFEQGSETVVIDQTDPWNVRINLTANITIRDKSNLASWIMPRKTIISYIPIQGFIDPVYVVETYYSYSPHINYINRSTYNLSVSSQLAEHFENSLYIAHNDAPNFLQRFEGDLSPDPDGNGIESLVYNLPGGVFEDISRVDHDYFNLPPILSTTGPPFNGVAGLELGGTHDNCPASPYC